MLKNKGIARVYARAVFTVALEREKLDEWTDFLAKLNFVFFTYKNFFNNPKIDKKFKIKLINQSFSIMPETDFGFFVKKIISKNRFGIIKELLDIFKEYVDDFNNVLRVDVFTSFELKEQLKFNLVSILQEKFKKIVSATFKIDNNLLIGYVVRAKNILIDCSIWSV